MAEGARSGSGIETADVRVDVGADVAGVEGRGTSTSGTECKHPQKAEWADNSVFERESQSMMTLVGTR